jgi:hypothetical protein
MIEHDRDLPTDTEDPNREQPGESQLFDHYRSLVDPSLMIFVKKDVVPPFRFKAGGWELVKSSIALGAAMIARISENGFFMYRANEDQSGGTELTDLLACSRSTEAPVGSDQEAKAIGNALAHLNSAGLAGGREHLKDLTEMFKQMKDQA